MNKYYIVIIEGKAVKKFKIEKFKTIEGIIVKDINNRPHIFEIRKHKTKDEAIQHLKMIKKTAGNLFDATFVIKHLYEE